MISVPNLVAGLIALLIVSTGFTYHLGFRHGWAAGFASGKTSGDEQPQPRVKHIVGFVYALGWHKGWDYGFREVTRKKPK